MIDLLLTLALLAGAPPAPPAALTYTSSVAPVLAGNCVPCHGPEIDHGGLRLDSYEATLRGGDSGPAISPGDAKHSLLVLKVEHRDRPVMPPRRRLPRATIALLRAWIDQGAPP
jgi:hypothetical protein